MMTGMATRTREPVVLPYTIRRSGAAMAVPVGGSEFLRFDALLEYFPWRGAAVALGLLGLWSVAALRLAWPWLEWAWIAALILGLGACISEGLHRRDRLTSEGIERRSGLFGRRRRSVPYRSVESVKVELPRRGSIFDVGTLVLRADGRDLRLVAIVAPHEVARLIEQARTAVKHASPGGG
jgi:hypothetical protein